MLTQLTWLTGRRTKRRRLPSEVRSAPDFHRLLKKERMRADRAQSMFSLLAIQPPEDEECRRAMVTLARRVLKRVRFSDDVGMLGDGRLGVFLPDTPVAGAWKVAEDIRSMYAHQLVVPDCEVYAYPFGPLWEDDDQASEPPPRGRHVRLELALIGAAHDGSMHQGS